MHLLCFSSVEIFIDSVNLDKDIDVFFVILFLLFISNLFIFII